MLAALHFVELELKLGAGGAGSRWQRAHAKEGGPELTLVRSLLSQLRLEEVHRIRRTQEPGSNMLHELATPITLPYPLLPKGSSQLVGPCSTRSEVVTELELISTARSLVSRLGRVPNSDGGGLSC